MLGTSLYHMIRTGLKRPVIMAFVFGVVCYCVQAVVNISVPMVMPLVMLLIAIGISEEDRIPDCIGPKEYGFI